MQRKTSLSLILSTAAILTAGAATAQSMPFSQIDTDGDGFLSNEELVAAFGEEGATVLLGYDADGDGMLTVAEATANQMSDDGMADGAMAADSGESGDMDDTEDMAGEDDNEEDERSYRVEDDSGIDINDSLAETDEERDDDDDGEDDERNEDADADTEGAKN